VYAGDREVSVEDVETVVVSTRQRSVFELADAVGQRKRGAALQALGSLIAARESGVRIVAMLARHVRQLWTARELSAERLSKFDLASALGVPPFFVDGIQAQARRLDPPALERMHGALYRADVALKSARLPDERILEALVLELTASPGSTGRLQLRPPPRR
jgi:DNA polymerase-3 subunit delta